MFTDSETTYDDDMQILRVIEAYCWTKNQRQTIAPSSSEFSKLKFLNFVALLTPETWETKCVLRHNCLDFIVADNQLTV